MRTSPAEKNGENTSIGLSGLEFFRKKAGLTQENLAREIDITVGHLWKIARGHRNASAEVISRLCAKLDCTPNDLMGFSS